MDNLTRTTIWMLLLIQGAESGQDKVWRRSTSWRDSANWLRGRPPCAGERAVLANVPVGLPQGSTSVREVVFSADGGELIFPVTADLLVTGVSDSRCPPQDALFMRSEALAWMDPGNWRLRGADFSAAVPHTERIPCGGDRAVFPPDDSFYVILPATSNAVAAVYIDGEDLNDDEWKQFLQSDRGRSQFLSRFTTPSVTVVEGGCEEAPCRCHEDAAMVELEVCLFVSLICPPTPCVTPIQPRGHCCPLCGAALDIAHGAATSRLVLDALERNLPEGVEMHASLGDYDNNVYVIMVDRGGYRGLSSGAVDSMAKKLTTDPHLQIQSVAVLASGPAVRMSWASSFFSSILGTMAMVIVVLGICYFLVYSRYTLPALKVESPPFVRFENVSVEAEDDASVKVVSPPPQPPPSAASGVSRQSFDNPMYGQLQELRAGTLENPTYHELQQRHEKEDLEEVDIESSSSSP